MTSHRQHTSIDGRESFAGSVVTVQVERVEGQDAEDAASRHAELHFGGVGVDAPQETDLYYRLLVDRCFYVGGMGSKCQAEVITSSEYMVRTALGHSAVMSFPAGTLMLLQLLKQQRRCTCAACCYNVRPRSLSLGW